MKLSAAAYGGSIEKGEHATTNKKFPYSVQLSVNLLANDPIGPIQAESKVVRRGRMTVVDTEVRNREGQPMALMRSTHMMVDASKVGPHLKG
jgi:acyl-coenzyme A thioesterase PaaI-like protein